MKKKKSEDEIRKEALEQARQKEIEDFEKYSKQYIKQKKERQYISVKMILDDR